jgi:hypothetical protein
VVPVADRHGVARARRAAATLVGSAVVLLAGCGGGGGSSVEPKTVEEQIGLERDGIVLRQAQAENLIRECMKAQGFDYTPVPEPVGSSLSDEEFHKQYGYGITTLYDKRQAAAGEANQTARSSLGDAERVAYDRALYGNDTTATFADAIDNGDFTRVGGCTKKATDQVFGGVEVIQSLQTKLDALDERILADPRVVKAVRKWSACMTEAGYDDLASPDEVDIVLHSKLEALVGPPENPKPDYDRAALAALQREEVAMVAADLKCEAKHITAVDQKVRADFEASFRDQNTDLLNKVPPP